MQIHDVRIKQLVDTFLKKINTYDLISEYLDDVVFVTRHTASKQSQDAVAYIKRSGVGIQGNPTYKIYLIKEDILKCSDKEILFTLAHEFSHIIFHIAQDSRRPESHLVVERACDILAKALFGFPQPAGSTVGYIHDAQKWRRRKK